MPSDAFFIGGGGGGGRRRTPKASAAAAEGGERKRRRQTNGHPTGMVKKGRQSTGGSNVREGNNRASQRDDGMGANDEEEDDELGYDATMDDDEDRRGRRRGGAHEATFLPEELNPSGIDEEGEEETAAEKRVRLAKRVLTQLQDEAGLYGGYGEVDAAEIDRENIASRLRQDALRVVGKLKQELADKIVPAIDVTHSRYMRGHQRPLTALAIDFNSKIAFSASKEAVIIKWDLTTGVRLSKTAQVHKSHSQNKEQHTDQILALALSSDGKYLASGGLDKLIHVWDASTLTHRGVFQQHRGPVLGLVFRQGSHHLYSASFDRTVKIWDVDQMSYVDTLYGHQENVTAIDCLTRERCVTAGGRDRTVRLWKIVEGSQLLFRSNPASIDAVKMINDEYFVSGDDQGSLCIWNINKKKPVAQVVHAHGAGFWIVSVATIPYADIVASGSWDGQIRLWKLRTDSPPSLTQIGQIDQVGFINALAFSPDATLLVAAIGQEHRMGRWQRVAEAKNLVRVVPISIPAASSTSIRHDSFEPKLPSSSVEPMRLL